ncbi:PREDICTED: zinc finger CCCH domain-containing 37 isoform [Prunus dulcis]|uniref:PREDICTED: zinc finger CCCH domain-containing 37 isoform n=1 Tax=Prunus dulcis TaxID=3755 RepID=A0A5E4GGT0_PRUDU|nr:PREDICTED: zinc finger CCCH domain-containing 37 isoform [Prunus dulcis]
MGAGVAGSWVLGLRVWVEGSRVGGRRNRRGNRHSRHLQRLQLTCPNDSYLSDLTLRYLSEWDPSVSATDDHSRSSSMYLSSWPTPDVEPGVKLPSEGSACRFQVNPFLRDMESQIVHINTL